ncbi:hypothetical protein N656DRAFT_773263, partial [Canariomyces notabilis]
PPTVQRQPTKVRLDPLFIAFVELKLREDLGARESLAEQSRRIQMSLAITG